MPRKSPDNVTEMRVTFGTYERKAIIEPIEKTIKSVALTSQVASGVVATGAVLAGGGLLLGAYGLWRFIGADPLKEIKEVFNETLVKAGGVVSDIIEADPPGPIDDIAKGFLDDVLGEGFLTFQALGEARKRAQTKKERVCLSGSQYYDEAACVIATEEYAQANSAVNLRIAQMKNSRDKAKKEGKYEAVKSYISLLF